MPGNQRIAAFSEVVERIYAGAIGDAEWESVSSSICSFLGTDSALILTGHPERHVFEVRRAGLIESDYLYYLTHRTGDVEIVRAVLARPSAGVLSPAGTTLGEPETGSTTIPEAPYVPRDIIFRTCVYLPIDNSLYCGISVQNADHLGDVTTEQMRTLELLGRHLRIALRIRESMHTLRGRQGSAETVLRYWRVALIRCDCEGWVLDTQGGTDALLRRFASVLHIHGGRLQATAPGANARLMGLLANPTHGKSYASPTVSLTGDSEWESLECTVIAESGEDKGEGTVGERLVVLRQGGDTHAVDTHYLRRRLGLTRTEADVLARLMLGTDVAAIAKARGSTLGTIRFYLKALRRKLACRNQGQLIAVGWRAVSFAPSSLGR